jgi:membrane protease YdiL (CAAX protease family)
MARFVRDHPYLFCIALFVVQPLLAVPFVAVFRAGGLEITPLRLVIPVVQSAFAIWVVARLGWWRRAGLVPDAARGLALFALPLALVFLPWAVNGTIAIPAGPVAFYALALVFTGISEEVFARGLVLGALVPRGKWLALGIAAVLFSAGHLTNAFFESFDALEWLDKFSATFSFAILYGALFLRTGALWPLVVLHMLHDFALVTAGAAGPFTVAPLPLALNLSVYLAITLYGLWITRGPLAPALSGAD